MFFQSRGSESDHGHACLDGYALRLTRDSGPFSYSFLRIQHVGVPLQVMDLAQEQAKMRQREPQRRRRDRRRRWLRRQAEREEALLAQTEFRELTFRELKSLAAKGRPGRTFVTVRKLRRFDPSEMQPWTPDEVVH